MSESMKQRLSVLVLRKLFINGVCGNACPSCGGDLEVEVNLIRCLSNCDDFPLRSETAWDAAMAEAQREKRVLVEATQRLGTISDTIWVTAKNAYPAARAPILCPHGNAPYYPAHGTWCMYCFAELEDAIEQTQAALREVGALEEHDAKATR